MANTLNTPDVLTQPIATNGTKNAIPNTNDQSLGLMSQSTGFPAICSERIADGGKAPRRADFNGAFNLVSQHHFFLQNGGTETFRQSVSDAIGGYPINSRLWFTNSNGESVIVRSLIANNTYNFNNDPSYIDGIKWVVDVESGAPVGSLMPYAGTTPPDGWLICDGSEISRTTYARLFSVIGTTYGAGDGNSSFNLPTLTNNFITAIKNSTDTDRSAYIKFSNSVAIQWGATSGTGSWGHREFLLPFAMETYSFANAMAPRNSSTTDWTSTQYMTGRGSTRGQYFGTGVQSLDIQGYENTQYIRIGKIADTPQTVVCIKY